MALEDIIKTNRTYGDRSQRGRGRGRGRGGFGASSGAFRRIRSGNTRTTPYRNQRQRTEQSTFSEDTVWEHDLYQEEEEEVEEEQPQRGGGGRVRAIETGTKIKITNLDFNVSEENLQELFEGVGAVKKASIKYDRSGRSEGEAEVTFARRADAQTALRKYQGTLVDGKAVRLAIVGSNIAVEERAPRSGRGGGFRAGRGERTGFIVSTRGGNRRLRVGGNRGSFRRGGRRGGRAHMDVE